MSQRLNVLHIQSKDMPLLVVKTGGEGSWEP